MTTLELIILIAVVGVLAVGGGIAGLVAGRRRSAPPVPPAPSADTIAPAPTAEDAVVDVPVEVPLEEPAAPVLDQPVLDKPEGTASRLVRLRQRLAGSQNVLGRGLLALLSRDRLDEDTWESLEDLLLTEIGRAHV